jgi:hypothetical protein
VANLGRTVTGTVPITEGTVKIGVSGKPAAISGSLDLGAIDTGHAAGTRTFASRGSSISTATRP